MIADKGCNLDISSAIGRQLSDVILCQDRDLAIADAVNSAGQYSAIGGKPPPVGAPNGSNAGVWPLCRKSRSRAVRRTQILLRVATSAPMHPVSS